MRFYVIRKKFLSDNNFELILKGTIDVLDAMTEFTMQKKLSPMVLIGTR